MPWAVYLMKTGDQGFVAQNFATEGPQGASQPSIEDSADAIAAARTGPMGTMEATNDIDTQGYWTTDDYEALLGLAAYRYLASALGNPTEAAWATRQYNSLLAAVNTVLGQTIARNGLDYLPCSLLQPNTANRCTNPSDANWTSPFGFGSWGWEGYLLGAPLSGPGLSMIDATYAYGFGRLRGVLPPGTAGGFPGDYYSSGYNAAMGAAGLASSRTPGPGHRGLRVHGRQQPERAAVVVGELERPGPRLALGRPPSRHGPGVVTARLGHRRGQQGAARLAGGRARRGRARGRPGRPPGMAAQRHADHGHQLPHHGRPARRPHDHRHRAIGFADAARRVTAGARAVRAPFLHRQHRNDVHRHRRRGRRYRHRETHGPARDRHTPHAADRRVTTEIADDGSHSSRWLTLAVLCFSILIVNLDNTVLNVALPTLVRDLGATSSELQWIVDAYALVFGGLLLVFGSLADHVGRKRTFIVGLIAFACGSAWAAFSGSVPVLIAARASMGIGAALMMPSTLSIITDVFRDDAERQRAIGFWAGTSGVGFALGPIIGGLLLSHFWWGSVFLINVPIAVLGVCCAIPLVPDSRNPHASRPDLFGGVLSIAGVGLVLWSIIEAPSHGWSSSLVVVPGLTGLAVTGGFIAWERTSTHPMLNLGFFRRRSFSVAVCCMGLGAFASWARSSSSPSFFSSTSGTPPSRPASGCCPSRRRWLSSRPPRRWSPGLSG